MLFAAIVFAGCASKDDVSPAEVENLAFEILRNEIRAVIDAIWNGYFAEIDQ